jgi:dihydrofolate reductase
MIGGGAQVYAQAMPLATHQVLTEVHLRPEGDTYYPAYPAFDPAEWRQTRREARDGFDWVWLERA